MPFIKLNSDTKQTTQYPVYPAQKESGTNKTSSAQQSAFYKIYAEQLMNSALNPVIQTDSTDQTDASATSLINPDIFSANSLMPKTTQNPFAPVPTPQPTNYDPDSIFGLMLGKEMPYFDQKTQELKKGTVIKVELDENHAPFFRLDNGVTVHLEGIADE